MFDAAQYAGLVVAVVVALYFWSRRGRPSLPYPPGPPGVPILGNFFDIPASFQWLTYTEWSKKFGDIMHIQVLGQHLVIINSHEIAEELLEKRSRNYADRPEIAVMHMNGWQVNMGLKHYGNEWRRDRRVLHQRLRGEVASDLHPLETSRCRTLLQDLLKEPHDFEYHFQLYPASIIMHLLYGHAAARGDKMVGLTFETIWLFSGAVFPGTNLINMCPPLRHLPEWFPIPIIRELHKRCALSRRLLRRMQDIPFDSVRKHMNDGDVVQCWVSDLLEQNARKGEEVVPEDVIKALGASTFAAAMETIMTFLNTFVLAMVLFPEAQARAQAEIDTVIGNGRLPDFDDRESLPYVEALIRELLRWHGPAPLGVPHAVVDDDIYKGYLIPKGAILIYNQWGMWRDERVYSNPDDFVPERFLTTDGKLTGAPPPTFGFGRRACVGKSTADASMWIAVASLLAVFQFNKAKDQYGKEIEVVAEFGDGIVSSPLPFKCSITPRSDLHRSLILDNEPQKLDCNTMIYD